MTQRELMPKVQKAFSKVFGQQLPFDPELARSSEGRWTSLKHVELIIALEVEFCVRFDGADAVDMTSVKAVVDKLEQKLQ